MSDIDFDELDRAVNSLISSAPKPDPTAISAAPVPDIASTSIPNSISEPSRTVINQPAVSQSLAGQRSSGRFMDVIHPSTDMRSSVVTPSPVSNPIRTSTPVASRAAISDFTRTSTPIAQPAAAAPVIESSESPITDITTPNSSLESPFISGAKVEKRPLGAFSNESASTVELTPSGEVEEKAADATISSSSEQMNSAMPEELQSDLLKIESGNSEADITTTESAPVEAPAFESNPAGPTSIIQQYKEQSAATDQKTSPIYDTNVYHKPLTVDGKKKSGWMWIIWIVLLLVVGIGAGIVTYFYILPLIG